MRWLILALLLVIAGCPKQHADGTAESAGSTAGGTDTKTSGSATPSAAAEGSILVYADPALKAPLEALGEQFRQQHSPGWRLELVESGDIDERVASLPEPERPHVILTDKRTTDELNNSGFLDIVTSRSFAGDRLCVVSRAGEDWRPRSFFDLYRMRFKGLGIGDENTLMGLYAGDALLTSGSKGRVEERLMPSASTMGVFDSLAKDETQLAIVFSSLAAQVPNVQTVLLIDEDVHEDVRYQATATKGMSEVDGVMKLLVFIAENESIQQQLASFGLQDRKTAMVDNK